MFNLKKFFFPFDRFSYRVLRQLNVYQKPVTILTLWKGVSENSHFPEVPIGKLKLTLQRMVKNDLVKTFPDDIHAIPTEYQITDEGRKILAESVKLYFG